MTPDPVFEAFSAALEANPEHPLEALSTLDCPSEDVRSRAARLLEVHVRASNALGAPFVPAERDLDGDGSLSPGHQAGPFRIVRELDRGGMARVYVAERVEPYRETVVLKVPNHRILSADLRERFHRERQLLADVRHPFVVSLLGGGELDDGTPYAAMEFVDGEHIDVFCRGRGLSVNDTLALFRRVCEAVAYVHQHNIIHRDLKPSNILIREDGTPKLLDFGIAKLLEPVGESGLATAVGVRLMTPDYASPEQRAGDVALTPASDVFSLGMILCELVTGDRPVVVAGEFMAPGTPASKSPDRWSIQGNVPAAVEGILHRMLCPAPSDRYQRVEDVISDIEAFLDGRVLSHAPRQRACRVWDRLFAGHSAFVAAISAAYAVLCALAALGEVAYRLSQHRDILVPLVSIALAGGAVVVPISLWVTWRSVLAERDTALVHGVLAHAVAAVALWVAVTQFLPGIPVVDAEFQTYTAQTGFLKGLLQYFLIFVPCMLLPFHFVLSVEHELRAGRHASILSLLSGESQSIAPAGTLYVTAKWVVIYLSVIAIWIVGGAVFLFNNLRPSAHMNLFIALVLARIVISLGFGAAGVLWYALRLEELKRASSRASLSLLR